MKNDFLSVEPLFTINMDANKRPPVTWITQEKQAQVILYTPEETNWGFSVLLKGTSATRGAGDQTTNPEVSKQVSLHHLKSRITSITFQAVEGSLIHLFLRCKVFIDPLLIMAPSLYYPAILGIWWLCEEFSFLTWCTVSTDVCVELFTQIWIVSFGNSVAGVMV